MDAVEDSRGGRSGWEEEQAALANKNQADLKVAGIYLLVYFKLFKKSSILTFELGYDEEFFRSGRASRQREK